MCLQVLAVISRQHLGGGWQEMEWGVRSGGLMFEKFYGAPFFKHLTDVPGLETTYSRGMAALDHSCEGSAAHACANVPLALHPQFFSSLHCQGGTLLSAASHCGAQCGCWGDCSSASAVLKDEGVSQACMCSPRR